MLKVSLVITMLLGGSAVDAPAAPLSLYLNAQAQATGFPGSGQVITGFFTYDAATGFSADWNFQANGMPFLSGPFPLSCPPGDCLITSSNFDPNTHSVVYQTCVLAGGLCFPTETATASTNFDNTFSFSSAGHQTSTVLHLELAQSLTAGGTIPLIPAAPCMVGQPPVCEPSSPGSYIGETFPASPFFLTPLTGSVTLVPEPESVLYVLFGLAVLAARRGRQFLKT